MNILEGMQLTGPICLAIVGSGGKTSALFKIARLLAAPVVVTTSTHLGFEQSRLADVHYEITDSGQIKHLEFSAEPKVYLITGQGTSDRRWAGLNPERLEELRIKASTAAIHVLIEADGSRGLPLKAPAAHEPAIPAWATHVLVVAGLSGLNKPLDSGTVHRPTQFGSASGLAEGELILAEHIIRVLSSPEGGLKNIPPGARRLALLNQADDDILKAAGKKIAEGLVEFYDAVLIASLHSRDAEAVSAVYKPAAGIILAAGGSSRFGSPKALLRWHDRAFVEIVARKAIAAGLNPVVVVTGEHDTEIRLAAGDVAVQFVKNPDWRSGQASSIKAGLASLPENSGSAIFLLVDQPQVSEDILQALLEAHRQTLDSILIPQIDGRRGTPVLFDQQTFAELAKIEGDAGGRQIFPLFKTQWLPWNDASLLLDVDRPEDYQRLLDLPQ